MPTYDYVCVNCGHRLEVLHGVNAPGPTTCPACGGRLRRSFSPPTIHFKGSGWAKVDRRTASASRSSKKDAETAPAGAPGDGGSKASEGGSGARESGSSESGSSESSSSESSSSEAAPQATPQRPKRSGAEGTAAESKTKASNAGE